MNRNNPTYPVSSLGTSTTPPVDASTLFKTSPPSTGRLLVLVPADADYGAAIPRIWQLLSDGSTTAEARIEFGTSWMDAVQRSYQPGDLLVCFAEQRDGLLHKTLQQVLEAHFDAPVFILSDLHPQRLSTRNLLSGLLLWAGLIGLIAGAFLLQTRLMSLPRDWSQTTLLLISVFAEFWLLRAWNNLFR
jgi:hypothetical protein